MSDPTLTKSSNPDAGQRLAELGELPTFASGLEALIRAENGDGWLHRCDATQQFLVPTSEFMSALVGLLARLTPGPIVEVCAGRGELTRALTDTGLRMVATDANAAEQGPVEHLDASEALDRYRPTVVLGSFVPFDSGVDELVMACPSVQHYVVLNARIGGVFASQALWHPPTWSAELFDAGTQWMLTRHDIWLGGYHNNVIQHGEAWHFFRSPGPGR